MGREKKKTKADGFLDGETGLEVSSGTVLIECSQEAQGQQAT